ncbi:hypothetical protein CAS74_000175 [Pichia kudriavzevii]|uniref:Uncharacterized protein n=1 Tax=Pichia kudriavzevii TaxID=4909 RepID=A0A099NY52_PICKU|nr:hypothetical protein JL09_g3326 [Pichia kudriavzevii]OUT23805.1 hypothetical protein CAS74_000175 [Pichia kudriavzevii]
MNIDLTAIDGGKLYYPLLQGHPQVYKATGLINTITIPPFLFTAIWKLPKDDFSQTLVNASIATKREISVLLDTTGGVYVLRPDVVSRTVELCTVEEATGGNKEKDIRSKYERLVRGEFRMRRIVLPSRQQRHLESILVSSLVYKHGLDDNTQLDVTGVEETLDSLLAILHVRK